MKSRIITATTLILFSCISFSAIAQTDFTNKAEATNQIVDSVKEGKWIEYFNTALKETAKDSATYYRLVIYNKGRENGIARRYMIAEDVLLAETPYVNGRREGIAKGYFPNGVLKVVTNFHNDQIEGVQKQYYQNGKTDWIIPYYSSKIHGIAKEYYPTDTLKAEIPYSYGAKYGVSKEYYDDGELKTETPYVNGAKSGVEKMYYKFSPETPNKRNPDNIEWQTPYTNGKINGTQLHYSTDGSKTEFEFLNGKKI